MRFLNSVYALALCALPLASAKSSWGFNEATLSVQSKGTGEGGRFVKEKLTPSKPLAVPVTLGSTDTLKILLTALDGKTAKRPHQAFLTLTQPASGLEDSYALQVKDTGKGKLDVAYKDLPVQFQTSPSPLRATLTIASFGSSDPYTAHAFDLAVAQDSSAPPPPAAAPPLRYGKLPEIHHIFRADPSSPPAFITVAFGCLVFAMLPVLLGTWLTVGANLNALGDAFGAAPLAHAVFIASLLGLEAILLAYYVSWTLFQMLPAVAVVGACAFLSGSRALSEVQERRLAGKR